MTNRIRTQIIELGSEKVFINESVAAKMLNISRYYIRRSLEEKIPVNDLMFAYFSYGMNIKDLKDFYEQNYNSKITRSKKWQNLTKLAEKAPILT